MKDFIIEQIKKHKIIAIARGVKAENIIDTANALYKGGIRLLEITFAQNSPSCIADTAHAIKLLTSQFADKMYIGAGTVLTIEQVIAAKESGASYIISPNTDEEIIRYTLSAGLVSIPGALTPTEAVTAHRAGADFVKLFPAADLGIGYIKSLKAPLSHIKFLAVGSINSGNLKEFLDAGIAGVGIGSNIVNNLLINQGEYDKITKLAQEYTDILA